MNELAERDATGDIATIYAEIRRFWAVPYVSSMHAYRKTSPEMVVFGRLIRDALPPTPSGHGGVAR